MIKKLIIFSFLFFVSLVSNVYSQNMLIVSKKDQKIFYIDGYFDSNSADLAKTYCKNYNLNTYFFRSKNKEVFDVQVKKKLFKKDKLLWRFFCAINFTEAETKFNIVLFEKGFNSNLKKIDNSEIEVRVWETRIEPKKNIKTNNNKSNADNNSTWVTIFTLVILAYITWYFVRPSKKKKILKSTPKKEKPIKKTKADLIQEWRNNR